MAFTKGHIPYNKGWKMSSDIGKKIGDKLRGRRLSDVTRAKMSLAKTGIIFSQERRKNISIAKKGKKLNFIIWNKGKKTGIKHSKQFKKGQIPWNKGQKFSEETRKKMSLSRIGKYAREKHPNWKGGITPINKVIRRSQEYFLWRTAVFERDNYTCIWCGFKGYVEADHIKPFAYFPELRFAIDNGRTLCRDCHKKTFKENYDVKKR